jgi:hypothetical protein
MSPLCPRPLIHHVDGPETNKYARMLYERCGFSLTDECQPLPSNRDMTEVGMICHYDL